MEAWQMPDLKQLREGVAELSAEIAEVFDKTKDGDTYDFQKADAAWLGDDILALKGTEKSARVRDLVQERMAELEEKQAELKKEEEFDQQRRAFEKANNDPVAQPGHPSPQQKDDPRGVQRKTFAREFMEHPIFKQWQEAEFHPSRCQPITLDRGIFEEKTLFETTAGHPPESTRTGYIVDAVTRPLQAIDVIPAGRTGQENVVYMQETTRTHAAAEKAEGAAYAESTFVLAEATSPVRKVTDSIPVTDEQMEDVAGVESYLESRLNFGVMQRLDGQVISGDGVAPNIDGIVNVTGIQTQAKGADPTFDAVRKAITKVRVTGRSVPTHIGMHPNDWQEVALTRTADGLYILGNPDSATPMRLWGLPVFENESLTEGTGLVGSFMPLWIQLAERRGVTVEMGFVNDDFTKGRKTLRASGRWALPVYRPAAFCTVTGI